MLKRILPFIIMGVMLPVMLLGADGGVMGWLQERWITIVGMVVITLGSFAIPGLRTIMVLALKTLVSEAVLKKIFLALAQKLVDSTKTKIDDIWLAELKKQL